MQSCQSPRAPFPPDPEAINCIVNITILLPVVLSFLPLYLYVHPHTNNNQKNRAWLWKRQCNDQCISCLYRFPEFFFVPTTLCLLVIPESGSAAVTSNEEDEDMVLLSCVLTQVLMMRYYSECIRIDVMTHTETGISDGSCSPRTHNTHHIIHTHMLW